jgi:hypothetical protein
MVIVKVGDLIAAPAFTPATVILLTEVKAALSVPVRLT